MTSKTVARQAAPSGPEYLGTPGSLFSNIYSHPAMKALLAGAVDSSLERTDSIAAEHKLRSIVSDGLDQRAFTFGQSPKVDVRLDLWPIGAAHVLFTPVVGFTDVDPTLNTSLFQVTSADAQVRSDLAEVIRRFAALYPGREIFVAEAASGFLLGDHTTCKLGGNCLSVHKAHVHLIAAPGWFRTSTPELVRRVDELLTRAPYAWNEIGKHRVRTTEMVPDIAQHMKQVAERLGRPLELEPPHFRISRVSIGEHGQPAFDTVTWLRTTEEEHVPSQFLRLVFTGLFYNSDVLADPNGTRALWDWKNIATLFELAPKTDDDAVLERTLWGGKVAGRDQIVGLPKYNVERVASDIVDFWRRYYEQGMPALLAGLQS